MWNKCSFLSLSLFYSTRYFFCVLLFFFSIERATNNQRSEFVVCCMCAFFFLSMVKQNSLYDLLLLLLLLTARRPCSSNTIVFFNQRIRTVFFLIFQRTLVYSCGRFIINTRARCNSQNTWLLSSILLCACALDFIQEKNALLLPMLSFRSVCCYQHLVCIRSIERLIQFELIFFQWQFAFINAHHLCWKSYFLSTNHYKVQLNHWKKKERVLLEFHSCFVKFFVPFSRKLACEVDWHMNGITHQN